MNAHVPRIKLNFIVALLMGVSICPVLLAAIPAMVDYPNHLARMFILTEDGTPDANPFYQVTWALYPNLAMDLVIPRLAPLMSVETATRTFLLFSQVLVVTGAIAIERIVKGRFHIAGPVAVMFLYCLPFAWGFVNFEFSLGISLWGIALSLGVQERAWPLRLAVNSILVAVLFVGHFFALGIYGATLGLHELWRAWERKAAYVDTLARLAVLAIPAGALLGLMALTGGSVGGAGTQWFFEFKPLWLIHIMNGYSLTVSAFSVAMVIGLLYTGGKRGAVRLEPAGTWIATGFAILYLALPSHLFETSFVDLRIIVAAAFILPAFVTVSFPYYQWRLATMACVLSITTANLTVVLFVWTSYRAEYAAMIESFRKIDKGSLVLVGHGGEGEDPPMRDLAGYPIYHAPTLAVHYAKAFVPTLFTGVGKQPVTVRASYQHLAIPYGGPAPIAVLTTIAEGRIPTSVPSFIRAWHRDFDYLYIVGPRIPNPMPVLLEELDGASQFALYKIRKPKL